MMILFVFAAAWAAFTISAVAGGGAGFVLVPLLRAIVAIESVPAALSIGTAASAVSRIAVFRRSIRWDVVRRFVPGALPAAALGAWLLTKVQPAYVELILACFLLANLPALLRRRAPEQNVRPLAPRAIPFIGAAAGLLSGFTGAVGLLFNGAYHRLGLDKHEIVATRAMNEVLLHLLKLALYAMFGLLDRAALSAGLLVAVAAILASLSVRHILPLIREASFRRIGRLATVASGVAMFFLSSGQLMRLHEAWVALVSPGGEHERQLHWRGRQRIAIEAEPGEWLVLERAIAFEALPAATQQAALAQIPRDAVTLVEEVRGRAGTSYEVYYRQAGRTAKIELGGAAG